MAPFLFILIRQEHFGWALALFLAAGISDALDGAAARKLGAQSRFGEVLDPVADKLLLSGVIFVLAMEGYVDWWLAGVVFGRDLLILLFAAGVLVLSKSRRRFPPSPLGKASTLMQILFVLAILGFLAGITPVFLVPVFKWLTAALTVLSAGDYARRIRN